MGKWKIYTPEGVQDYLFEDCFQKRNIEDNVRQLFRRWGFMEIETPTIEFFDTFTSGEEFLPQEKMFKFFDKQGRILVLRPDLTVPVARVVATRHKEMSLPVKYFYIGNCFRYNDAGGGKQSEFTQAGVEIIGATNIEAEAEVIATAIYASKACGLTNFQIDLGQVEFFKGIVEEAGLSDEEAEELRILIDKKDYLGVENLIKAHGVEGNLKKLILELPGLFGSKEILSKAENLTTNARSLNAIRYLRRVLEILEDYECSEYVSVDLGMVQSINYYTGLIFKGFTHSIGFPYLSGGRYDNLVSNFGRDCAAIGFSIGINMVLSALQRQKVEAVQQTVDTLIYCEENARSLGFKLCMEFRRNSLNVEMDILQKGMENAIAYSKAKNIGGIIRVFSDGNLEVHDLVNDTVINTNMKELTKEM